MSRLLYGIQIWGLSASNSQLERIQVGKNLAIRWMTNKNKYTNLTDLLLEADMLSINQLAMYHLILTFWKIFYNGYPYQIYD